MAKNREQLLKKLQTLGYEVKEDLIDLGDRDCSKPAIAFDLEKSLDLKGAEPEQTLQALYGEAKGLIKSSGSIVPTVKCRITGKGVLSLRASLIVGACSSNEMEVAAKFAENLCLLADRLTMRRAS